MDKIISGDISRIEQKIKYQFACCDDVIIRTFKTGLLFKKKCVIVYIDGASDKRIISDLLLKTVMDSKFVLTNLKLKSVIDKAFIADKTPLAEISFFESYGELYGAVLNGDCVFIAEGEKQFLRIGSRKFPARTTSEPTSKRVVRGPRDGFVENIRDNTAMLRQKIMNKNLKIENLVLGYETHTQCALCHISGIADDKTVARLRLELSETDIKSVLESGYIQNALESRKKTFFPQMEAMERPDEASAALLQGRVVLIIDNTPFVLVVPGLFRSMMSSSEDFYETSYKRKLIMGLRVSSLVLTALLPAFYIAIVNFNPEFVSEKLITFILTSRKQVPFPAFYEILLIEFIFEIIIEASIRLPNQIGFTVGIVGTIVLGDAMVDANLVNLMVIIIVALTAILVFVIPNYTLALSVRILKFVFMFASALCGFFGIMICLIIVLVILCDMSPYGYEFLYPYVDSENKLKNVRKEGNMCGHDNL